MRNEFLTKDSGSTDETRLDLKTAVGRLSTAGPSLAVIALVAVIGIIIISAMSIALSERAIDKSNEQRITKQR